MSPESRQKKLALMQSLVQHALDEAEQLVGLLPAKDDVDELELADVERRQAIVPVAFLALSQAAGEASEVVRAGDGIQIGLVGGVALAAAQEAVIVAEQKHQQRQRHARKCLQSAHRRAGGADKRPGVAHADLIPVVHADGKEGGVVLPAPRRQRKS